LEPLPIELENIEAYIRRKTEPVMVTLDWIDEMAYLGDEVTNFNYFFSKNSICYLV
jgi:hypothetical protein